MIPVYYNDPDHLSIEKVGEDGQGGPLFCGGHSTLLLRHDAGVMKCCDPHIITFYRKSGGRYSTEITLPRTTGTIGLEA